MIMGSRCRTLAIAVVLVVALVPATLLAGCGNGGNGDGAASDGNGGAGAEAGVSGSGIDPASLSDTVVLSDGWEWTDAITFEEMDEFLGTEGYELYYENLNDPEGGKPQAGYWAGKGSGIETKINFLAYTSNGPSEYERVAGFVKEAESVESVLWSEAIIGEMTDAGSEYVAILVLRGDQCLRIRWMPEGYPDADREQFSVGLAELAIQNLYGQ